MQTSVPTEVATECPEHALLPALTLSSEDGPMVEDPRTISWEPIEYFLGLIEGHRAQARYNFRHSSRRDIWTLFLARSGLSVATSVGSSVIAGPTVARRVRRKSRRLV